MKNPLLLGFKGKATPRSASDVKAVADRLDIEVEKLLAVLEVEAAGSGFDHAGRPKILYEAHVFWRNLPRELREEANRQGLAWSHWERGRYPRGSDAMYETLAKAIEIDEDAALKACSWGAPQILGENFAMVGFATVQEMVAAFMDSERAQIEALAAYLEDASLGITLRCGDWAGFARVYNGPSYSVHRYDERLEEAYQRLIAHREPAAPEPVPAPVVVPSPLAAATVTATVTQLANAKQNAAPSPFPADGSGSGSGA